MRYSVIIDYFLPDFVHGGYDSCTYTLCKAADREEAEEIAETLFDNLKSKYQKLFEDFGIDWEMVTREDEDKKGKIYYYGDEAELYLQLEIYQKVG